MRDINRSVRKSSIRLTRSRSLGHLHNSRTSFHQKPKTNLQGQTPVRPKHPPPTIYSTGNLEPMRFFITGGKSQRNSTENKSKDGYFLFEFFEWITSQSEIEFLLATSGGECYIQRPIRILLSWLHFDTTDHSNAGSRKTVSGSKTSYLKQHHLQLAVLATELENTKILGQKIIDFNRRLTKETKADPTPNAKKAQNPQVQSFSLPPIITPETELKTENIKARVNSTF